MNEKADTTANGFCILVADRNPHVREFLRRELSIDGFQVLTAKDGREALRLLNSGNPPDLLVLDLDLPHVSGLEILKKLQDRKLRVPGVAHTFLTKYADHPAVRNSAAFVEKTGNNVDGFKLVINDVLRRWYPTRYVNQPDGEVSSSCT
ncbi:MAG: response regulator [Deltaproteobacteria bacterium]|nr:response regulator [Deltaproteobacteria bacterium]